MGSLERLYEKAFAHNQNQCGILKDGFQIEDWVRLVFGKAKFFCIDNKFPTLDIWKDIDSEYGIAKYGIFIENNDKPILFEGSRDQCLVVGDREYEVICDKLRPYRIVGMHGAKITIRGRNRAVIILETDGTCTITEDITENAILVHK